MLMYQITTLPVYSKLSPAEELPALIQSRLPENWQLSEHQLETYNATISNQYDVVINTAMTGDGKSLAAYLPPLLQDNPLFAMYPTNELARDQEVALPNMLEKWGCGNVPYGRVNAGILDELVATTTAKRKGQALETILANREIILTNPDIFHYLAQFFYTLKNDSPDMVFMRRVVNEFEQFVFDEFHIFQTPQIVAVMNALLLIRETAKNCKQFLFLSATPDDLLLDYLNKAQLKTKIIDTKGRYLHTREIPDPKQWRPIVRETAIIFDQLTPENRIEQWIEAHQSDILTFFQTHTPSAKGAIIVNSVASAYRLHGLLYSIMQQAGFTVTLNTGLTSKELKEVSRHSDLLIGTSTVDVGVDFRINFLIFESLDAGTFLQRLGRLGRHPDDGRGNTFHTFQAYALIPHYIQDRLFKATKEIPPPLSHQAEINREDLATIIRSAYTPKNQFRGYAQQWGWIQSVRVATQLRKYPIRTTYQQTIKDLQTHYWHVFNISLGKKAQEYKTLWQESRLLVEEAQSFRGDSPLQCGIIDPTETGHNQIKRYNLLTLARNAHLTWLGKKEFTQFAQQHFGEKLPFNPDDLAGWFTFHGFLPERHKIIFKLDHNLDNWSAEKFATPLILRKIRIDGDGLEWQNQLNNYLARRQFVVTICQQHPADLRAKLYLPPLFGLYECQSLYDDTPKSIAFARDALLLSTALHNHPLNCGGGAMIF